MARTADTWVEAHLARYPASAGTRIVRWAFKPLANAGSFKEPRLVSISRLRRACTDPDGNPEVGGGSIVVDDQDGELRAMLDEGSPEEYVVNREIGIYTLSEAGRAANLTPRTRFRGWITDVQLLEGRLVRIAFADVLSSQFSGISFDKTIGIPITAAEHPNAPPETLKKIYPIIGGEHSDLGAVDSNGASAEKGLVSAIDCGDYDISGNAQPPEYVQPPINVTAVVVGAGGSATWYYAVTAITNNGETIMSAVATVTGAPALADLSPSNYVKVTWDDADAYSLANTIAFRVCGRSSNPPTGWLDGMNNGGTFVNPEKEYHDDGDDLIEDPLPNLGTNTAQGNNNIFAWMLLSIGYSYEILKYFASDLAQGSAPKRAEMSGAVFGSEIIGPEHPEWPHADPWVERGGIRQFGFYARGPRLAHHRDGSVTMAVQMCGPHDDSDVLINQAGPLTQWLLNEHAAKNGGTGYRTGDYGPLETYANGDPVINPQAHTDAQDLSITYVGGLGYLMAFAITEPTSLREILRRIANSFGWRFAANHHGQVGPIVVNNLADPTVGRHLRDRIEIKRVEEDKMAWDEVLNRMPYAYHWDSDAGAFRAENLVAEHAQSIAAHVPGGVIGTADRRGIKQPSEPRQMYYVNDPTTATDVVQRELTRRKRRPRYVKPVVDLMGLDYDIGDQMRYTHYNGLGRDGDEATPMIILAIEEDPGRPGDEEIIFTLQDLRGIATGQSFILGDEASMPPTALPLGDETSTPPTALELH